MPFVALKLDRWTDYVILFSIGSMVIVLSYLFDFRAGAGFIIAWDAIRVSILSLFGFYGIRALIARYRRG